MIGELQDLWPDLGKRLTGEGGGVEVTLRGSEIILGGQESFLQIIEAAGQSLFLLNLYVSYNVFDTYSGLGTSDAVPKLACSSLRGSILDILEDLMYGLDILGDLLYGLNFSGDLLYTSLTSAECQETETRSSKWFSRSTNKQSHSLSRNSSDTLAFS